MLVFVIVAAPPADLWPEVRRSILLPGNAAVLVATVKVLVDLVSDTLSSSLEPLLVRQSRGLCWSLLLLCCCCCFEGELVVLG